ncbi:MAG: stage 0 sporulation family protein [Bacillota bacterium]|nr:stage 0 sporulation family protein [Bacillota bacterium]
MVNIIGIRFKKGGKTYYFDPLDIEINQGDFVVVETTRGIEMGECVIGKREVEEESLSHPLKPIIRKADELDFEIQASFKKKEEEASRIFVEKVAKHGLEMNLIEVEYAFSGNKITFYFTADGRVDFRELVKDLAYEFKMRIELRQIGVRDETKIVGGLGPCGRPCCCGQWLADFTPVSIKMAKDQNLSLHPVKISGLCNRLMCCLGYEHETYVQISEGMPGVFDKVKTPKGMGVVTATEILKGRVQVKLFTGGKNEGEEIIESFHRSEVEMVEAAKSERNDFSGEGFTLKDLKALED